MEANPESQTVGSTVTPIPPVRRYNDTVHHLAQTLAAIGLGGHRAIAQHMARAGWRIAKSTIGRYLKGPRVRGPIAPLPETLKRAVRARFPHHVWHLDLTEVQALAGRAAFSLAAVLDSFSRMPLVWRLFDARAAARDMCALLDTACAHYGRARHLVVDQGGEFTAGEFKEHVDGWGMKRRYCSAENHRANARLERFWRGSRRCSASGHSAGP